MESNINSQTKNKNKLKDEKLDSGKKSARKLLQSSDIQIKLEIQLQEDEIAILIIKGNEDPKVSVDKFCAENGLDDEIKECILDEVDKKIEENLKELEEIDEEIHDGSDLSNNHSQDNSFSKKNSNKKINNQNERKLKQENLNDINMKDPNNKILRNSKQSSSLKNEKIYYETNNFNNMKDNIRKKLKNNSDSDRYLSEEISISDEEKNSENNYLKNSNKKNNQKQKQNTSPEFYPKKEKKYNNVDNEREKSKNFYINNENKLDNTEQIKNENFIKNDKNSNRSRNQNNRNSNPNEIESHLSSDKNTYYTFNEQYNNKKRENKNNDNLANSKKDYFPDTFNSRENNKFNAIRHNKNNSGKKNIERYQESDDDFDDYNNKFNNKNKPICEEDDEDNVEDRNKNKFNKNIKSRNINSKNSKSNSNNSRSNSPVIIRKSIKYAAYEDSYSVSESENTNSLNKEKIRKFNSSEEDSFEKNNGKIYKYKKDKHIFEKQEIINSEGRDNIEENENVRDLRKNNYNNMENVKKKNQSDFEYHKNNFKKNEFSNSDLQKDLANEISKIHLKRQNSSSKANDEVDEDIDINKNNIEETNVPNLKAYYESNLNQNSLIGYDDFDSQKNPDLKNLNIIKNKNVQNKVSSHDYLNLNNNFYPKLNHNTDNKNISKEKKDIRYRKDWDNSKNLLFPLTTDKNKVEYSPSISYSNSRSKSRSLSNKNNNLNNSKNSISRSNSYERNLYNSKDDEEIKKAKKIYKENFLKNNKITDPNFIPGKRLYEQYQKKLPVKQEHHKQIKDNRLVEEIKEATFSPQIDKNSRKIFKRSQEKKSNKDASFNLNNENSNYNTSMNYITHNNFSSFSNSNINNITSDENNKMIVKNNNLNRNKSFDRVENRLINYGKISKSRILREKTKNSIQEANHSFHPTISEKSQIIASIKKKERIEKAKSFILNNTKDEYNNEYLNNNTCSDENISNDNEEINSKIKNKEKNIYKKKVKTLITLQMIV